MLAELKQRLSPSLLQYTASYLVLLVLTILIGSFSYYRTLRIIRKQVVETALSQLEEIDNLVRRIAREVDYQNFSTFYRAFKRRRGVSPGSYRRQIVALS